VHIEVVGGFLSLYGTVAVLPGCPGFVLFAYGPCSLSFPLGEIGFGMLVAGTVLVLAGEISRRKKTAQITLEGLIVAPEQQDILGISNELIEQLKIHSFRPASVFWTDYVPLTMPDSERIAPGAVPVGSEVPIGWCLFTWDKVFLPLEMKGKLENEEWRPLLASSLIYEAKLRNKRYLGKMLVSTPLVIDAVGWLALLAVSNPDSGIPKLLLILDIVGLIVAIVVAGFLAQWVSRRLRLRADTLAAEHIGREVLQTVLEKMKAFGLVDSYAGIGWDDRGRPTLAARLTNLDKKFD
jgi:hypothetical protein